jgi:hypothetical protein
MPSQVRLTLTNRSSRKLTFSLEPLGDYSDLEPSLSVTATFTTDSGEPHLELVVEDSGLSIWEESGDSMGLDPDRSGPGGERWA